MNILRGVIWLFLVKNCSSWLFSSWGAAKNENSEETIAQTAVEGKVPFEMATADEKFLAQAGSMQLSPLDLCHHMVIARLENTCSDLSEEELAKLAVQLLNCQSEAEGRPTFPCTDGMMIKECTEDMDGTTWNTYQIVSNRARALCYATRQQQFRMKTENVVNKLVYTTQEQLTTMEDIKKSQDDVNEATKTTLHHISESHEELMTRQMALKSAQANVHSQIVSNIRDLVREKAVIAAGNRELMEVAEQIQEKLETAANRLESQELQQQFNHDELLSDLSYIREKAKEVWEKIDESSQEVIHYHEETTKNYKDTIRNLERVNKTVAYILDAVDKMQSGIENTLRWLTNFVGGTGDRVAALATLLMHILYLFILMTSAAFLHTPIFSRFVLLLLLTLNAWAEMKQQTSLGFTSMITLILLTVLCNWVIEYLWYVCWRKRRSEHSARQNTSEFVNKKEIFLLSSPDGSLASSKSFSSEATAVQMRSSDMHRLAVLFDGLYKAGFLSSESEPEATLSPSRLQELEGTRNTKPKEERNNNNEKWADRDRRASRTEAPDQEESDCENEESDPETTTPAEAVALRPEKNFKESKSDSVKTRVEQVKRRILNSPSPYKEKQLSPARPFKSSPRNRRSRSNTPISMRDLCIATTKSGLPCRLLQVEGSSFCYRHRN